LADYYNISLEILHQLLKDAGEEHWANWIQKDIHLWASEKRVDHHLGAYGGMGSINDLSLGGLDTIDIWKNNLFEMTKKLAWSLAKGKVATPPLEEKFYHYGSIELSGWRCLDCRHARISKTNIELYVAAAFLPKLFVEYIEQDRLMEILDLENIITLMQITDKRATIEKLVKADNITLTDTNDWLQTCPNCGDNNVCVYRWQIVNNYSKLVAASNNL